MSLKRFSEQIVHLCLAAARPALAALVALAAFAGLFLLLSSGQAAVTAAPMMPSPLGLTAPPTSFTLSCPDTSTYGDNVTCMATAVPITTTGVVSFWDKFKGTSTEIGRSALDGLGRATITTSSLLAGSHEIKAVYEGGNYDATESNVETLTVAKATPSVTVTGPNSSDYGRESSVTFEATVTSGAGIPTGRVVFSGWGDDFEAALSDGKASFTPTESHDVGSVTITAEYQGDDNFNSASGTKNHMVNKADTTTELTSPLDESDHGQEVRFIASVSADPQGSKMPTGDVTFKSDGTVISGCENVSLGSPATCATSDLPVGEHDITAEYNGDTNFNISTSDIVTHTVNKTASETSLESSANPSEYGQAVTFTANVEAAGTGSGTPTGTVAFKDGGTDIAGCSSVALASGSASCTTSDLSAGAHNITAEYSGDANFDGSTSSTFVQTVIKPATTTTLSGPSSSAVGDSVTFTATVSKTLSGDPVTVGDVTFYDGLTALATVALNGAGQATYNTSSLSAGLHVMKAVYNGTPNFNPSTSSRLYHTVSAVGSTTTLISFSNPSVYGQNVTFQATVTGAGGTPTGQVTFKDGAATLGTGTLVAGVATFSTSTLAVGTHPITAVYGGDATFTGSTSNQVDQVVNKANTTTTITSDLPDPSVVGQPVPVNFTVTAQAPGSGTPSGNVTVSDGTASCVGTVAAGTCNLTPTTAGAKTLTATYAGDSNFTGSAGTTPHQVNPAATTTTVTSSPNPSLPGQNVTITANVTANAPGAGTPTGQVQFKSNGSNIGGPVALVGGSASVSTSFGSEDAYNITADYTNADGNFSNSSGSVTHNVSATPTDLSVTKTDSPDPVNVGDDLTYIIAVANHGPESTDVTLTDTLPPQVTFVSATPSQGNCNEAGGTVTCNLDAMASGGSATVTIVVNVSLTTPAGTVLRNTAQVNGARPDPDLSNNTSTEETTVYRAPRLGDCNGDDTVSLADIWSIVQDIFDPTFQGTSGCDANRDSKVDAGDVPSTVLIMFKDTGAASMGGDLNSVTGPALTMPQEVQAVAGQAIVPLTFAANGHSITSLAFSVNYDETWLTLDPTDRDGNGVPDAVVFNLPGDFTYSVAFDGDDTDGEVDIFIGDISPSLTSLPDGPIVFMLLDADSSPGRTKGAVRFSVDPSASFGDTSGRSVPGTATPGGEYRIYLPLVSH